MNSNKLKKIYIPKITNFLLKSQKSDGSWDSKEQDDSVKDEYDIFHPTWTVVDGLFIKTR